MTRKPIVTPNDLRTDPELAILDALDHTLGLAVYALVAIYPELTASEVPAWCHDDSTTGRAARDIIACGQKLESTVADYRDAILRAREAETNEDLPF